MDFYLVYYLLAIVMVPGIIFAAIAQGKVSSSFNAMSKIPAKSGKTAAQVAREMLDQNGLQNITIEKVKGDLTDHYNPKKGTIGLSTKVHDSTSIAAIGIAAHEVGHAIQTKQNYMPSKIRAVLVPILNISSKILWPLVIIGILLGALSSVENMAGQIMVWIGVGLFGLSTLFSLITLPTEYDASKRAQQQLAQMQILDSGELIGAKKVLSAAALTYVASLLVSILSLLRFVLAILVLRER